MFHVSRLLIGFNRVSSIRHVILVKTTNESVLKLLWLILFTFGDKCFLYFQLKLNQWGKDSLKKQSPKLSKISWNIVKTESFILQIYL